MPPNLARDLPARDFLTLSIFRSKGVTMPFHFAEIPDPGIGSRQPVERPAGRTTATSADISSNKSRHIADLEDKFYRILTSSFQIFFRCYRSGSRDCLVRRKPRGDGIWPKRTCQMA
jgi:hypothetical protein